MDIHAPLSVEAIADRLMDVRRRIAEAALGSGRDPGEVEVVVVTKGHPADVVRAAHAAGARHFGENRVEEFGPKLDDLGGLEGAIWHMVGHLQSRKVRDLPDQVRTVHSVDRQKIADRLDEWAGRRGRPLEILLECNVTGEASKAGWPAADPNQWDADILSFEEILRKSNLSTVGLMTMAPLGASPDLVRRGFSRLRDFRDHLERRLGVAWPHLSMGMTDDFEIAVEEGATLVRIGRAILGERTAG